METASLPFDGCLNMEGAIGEALCNTNCREGKPALSDRRGSTACGTAGVTVLFVLVSWTDRCPLFGY